MSAGVAGVLLASAADNYVGLAIAVVLTALLVFVLVFPERF